MKKTFTFVLTLFTLALSGCFERLDVEEANQQKILLFDNSTEPETIDPHLASGVPENAIISALFEGLVNYHPTDGSQSEPGVADRWETDDFVQWTFHLRKDARWSNGDPVSADDFVYSWERMLSPKLATKYAEALYILENGEAFNKGEITDFDDVGVKALDSQTLQVTLVGPTPIFLSMLKHYSFYPVHPPTIEKYGGMNNRLSRWTREGMVSNGPFLLDFWRMDQILTVKKNPRYWDAANTKLNGIHFFPINNANTMERDFRAGKLHYVKQPTLEKLTAYKERNDPALRLEPYLGTYFYRFNLGKKPLDNPLVRKALTLTVDQEAITSHVLNGDQVAAHSFTPPGIPGYDPPDRIHYSPEEGRKALAEAGYPNGEGFPSLTLLINKMEAHQVLGEVIQQMWKKELNIDIKIESQEWKVYLNSVHQKNYDIARAGWIGDYIDPMSFIGMWTTGNGNNETEWSNERFDQLNQLIKKEGDLRKRHAMMQEAENLLLDELPILPIYYYTRFYLIDPSVQNWNPKLLDNRPWKYIDLK